MLETISSHLKCNVKGAKKGTEKPRLPYAKNGHVVEIRKKQYFICSGAFSPFSSVPLYTQILYYRLFTGELGACAKATSVSWVHAQKNISDTQLSPRVPFLLLPHFDVFCYLLLNNHVATWNLFVKCSRACKTALFSRLENNTLTSCISVLSFRPVIHHTVSLEDACDTLQQLSQHTVGKIVVRM